MGKGATPNCPSAVDVRHACARMRVRPRTTPHPSQPAPRTPAHIAPRTPTRTAPNAHTSHFAHPTSGEKATARAPSPPGAPACLNATLTHSAACGRRHLPARAAAAPGPYHRPGLCLPAPPAPRLSLSSALPAAVALLPPLLSCLLALRRRAMPRARPRHGRALLRCYVTA